MALHRGVISVAVAALAAMAVSQVFAQVGGAPAAGAGAAAPAAAGGGRGGGAGETWWVNKTKGGVYNAPMRPLWKLSDLKQMHAGQNNWSEQIIKDPEQEATYNSGAPGTRISPRLHPDTPTMFVVIAGEVDFTVEGQPAVKAVRGSIVNIMKTTIYSAVVGGATNALWVEVDPANYKTVYPSSEPQPTPSVGGTIVRVAFNHTPGAYTAPNQLHWNLFEAIAQCNVANPKVNEDHLFANPLLSYANASENPCPAGGGRGGAAAGAAPGAAPAGAGAGAARGGAPAGAPAAPAAAAGAGRAGGAPAATPAAFNPNSVFGHMHAGPAEWWIVQVGHIDAKFEGTGEFHAEEGDVLYASPMSWHQMGGEGPGPSLRLAMGGYALINMNSIAGQ